MTYNKEHRSEIATQKLVKAFIEGRLWHGGNLAECGCALTQMGSGNYSSAKYLRLCGYSEDETQLIESAFEDYRFNHSMGSIYDEHFINKSPATFDDLLRTVDCLMELDKEYYERKPIRVCEDRIVLEVVE